jgi:hypothetical protein
MTSLKLDSGRIVSLASISVQDIYASLLLGDPLKMGELVLRLQTEQLVRQYGEYVLILKPAKPAVPPYRFVVSLHSNALPDELHWRLSSIVNKPPHSFVWGYSFVTVCWFQDGLEGDLVETIYRVIKRIDWEKHAKNSSH